jgi:hypothetical protein
MKPERFLELARELVLDEESEENVTDLLRRIENVPVDPPVLYLRGKQVVGHDGRHRAHAAMRLGMKMIPVLLIDVDGARGAGAGEPGSRKEVREQPVYFVGRTDPCVARLAAKVSALSDRTKSSSLFRRCAKWRSFFCTDKRTSA